MLERKIYRQLKEWKQNDNRKSLIVEGARQVGKTYAIETFGREEYKELISINFKEKPDAAEIFRSDLSVDNMLMALRFRFPEYSFIPGETLIFFDEIQECEEAITSLKFWTIDKRYDVIASGSMLGVDYKRASSFPVGYVNYIHLYGLDFEEFLWSRNITEKMLADIRVYFDSLTPVPDGVHSRMKELFRVYMTTGGMPEVVQKYADSRDFIEVDKVQREILNGYKYDIAHYAVAEEKVKAEKCFLSISRQLLNKENHKFQYKEIEKGARAQKYYSSLDWLVRADIVKICRNTSMVMYDLEDYAIDRNFRVYTSDLSLLVAMRDLAFKRGLLEDSLTDTTKGGIYECAIADILIKKEYPIYFYKNENTKKEIDFIIQKGGNVIPVEVKAGRSRATSLNILMKNNPRIETAYKIMDGNIGIGENGVISIPHYMAMFL